MDIIFMPYNYLFDYQLQKLNQVKMENAIIVFDEGHNIERSAEDGASFFISTQDLMNCHMDMNAIKTHKEQHSGKWEHIRNAEIKVVKFLI